jgi:O-antigen/teichoic acid export membrane protein
MKNTDRPHIETTGDAQRGMAEVAIRGTAWATGQVLLNKLATVLAVLVIAKFLSVSEFGVAALSLTVAKFLCVLPPLNMGDVLIARGSGAASAFEPARRTALAVGAMIAVTGMAASIPASWFFHEYPSQRLIPLVCVACLRPIGESMQVAALTQLRLQFRNGLIASIDGSVQLTGTVLSVLLAWYGFGAWALVATSTAVAFGKAITYQLAVHRVAGGFTGAPGHGTDVRHEFFAAAGGQYLHGVVDSLPFLMLGWLSSASETGLYAFAANLSGQANILVATQVSSVLQPVLGQLRGDTSRQSRGYLRAMSTLSALAVPVCLTQAIFSGVIFALVFDERWRDAAPVFAAMSILESFFFAAAPTMAMLKAQGRFRTFLAWQGCQLVVSVGIFALAALRGGSLAVAIAGAALWSVSLPSAVWLSIRQTGLGPSAAVRVFAAPWTTALPIGCVAWFAIDPLCSLGQGGRVAALFLVAPVTLIGMLLATRWSQPAVYVDLSGMLVRIASRVPLASRFIGPRRSL